MPHTILKVNQPKVISDQFGLVASEKKSLINFELTLT